MLVSRDREGIIDVWVIIMKYGEEYVLRYLPHNATADFKDFPEYVKTHKIEIPL